MKTERWKQINEVLLSALDREVAERSRFIKDVTGSDEELRREVVSLLASYEQAGAFLEDPVTEAAARLLADDPTHLAPGQQINHYKVLSLLGSGGMGEVYLVRDTRLGRRAAIKVLPSRFTQDRDRLRRFHHEARAASAL